MTNGATETYGTTGGFAVLLSGLCSRSCCLLLLVLLMLLLRLSRLLLLLLLCLLCFTFAFLFRQLPISFLAFPSKFRIRGRFEFEIRSAAGVVVATITSPHKDCRLRSMAFGVVRFRLRAGPSVHIVHR